MCIKILKSTLSYSHIILFLISFMMNCLGNLSKDQFADLSFFNSLNSQNCNSQSSNDIPEYHFNYSATDGSPSLVSTGKRNATLLTASFPTPVIGKDGDPAGAYFFDGVSQYLSLNPAEGLPVGRESFTVCAWANPDITSASRQPILDFGDSSGSGQQIQLALSGSEQAVYQNNIQILSSTGVKRGTNLWTHHCMVYDGNWLSLYINGIKSATTTVQLSHTSGELRIGNSLTGGYYFKGKIDDIRIFKSALQEQKIRTLATQSSESLIKLYDLNGDKKDVSSFCSDVREVGQPSLVPDRNDLGHSAYYLDGTSGILSGDSALVDLSYLTVSVWVRPKSNPSMMSYVFYHGTAKNGFGIFLDGTKGNTLNADIGGIHVTTQIKVPLHVWSHISLRFSFGSLEILMNGVSITTATNYSINQANSGLYIGMASDSASGFFHGDIDDLRFYGKSLSYSNIRAISGYHPMQVSSWNATSANSSLQLYFSADSFSYYKENDRISDSWIDHSGNAYHAVPINNPPYVPSAINNRPAVNFILTNYSYFNLGDTNIVFNGLSIFAVAQQGWQDAMWRPIFSKDNGACTNRINLHRKWVTPDYYLETPTGNVTATASLNENVIISGLISSTISIYSNGNLGTSGGITPITTATVDCNAQIGARTSTANNYFHGYISELILFNKSITDTSIYGTGWNDREIVQCYLSSKYGIAISNYCP